MKNITIIVGCYPNPSVVIPMRRLLSPSVVIPNRRLLFQSVGYYLHPIPPHPKCIQSLVCCKTHPRFQLLGTHQRETSIIMMFTIEKIETINRILSNFAL